MKKTSIQNRVATKSKIALFKSFIFAALLLAAGSSAMAQGDLLISPLRVIFDGAKKSQEISLANVGKDTATYAVSVVNIRMTENGSFEEITVPDSGQNFAGEYLRFFPRKVTLAPNEAQVVKVQLTKTTQLAPGEYRSHIYFRAVPNEEPVADKPKADSAKKADSLAFDKISDHPKGKDTGAISIALKPIFGITIPIIIRVGDNNADVTLSDVSFSNTEDKPKISFTFNRMGAMSVYGDIKVEYMKPGSKPSQLKVIKGVGVYTPNRLRHLNIDLDKDETIDFHKGKLLLTYTLQTNDKTPKTIQSEIELN